MRNEFYLILATSLLGIGLGAALARRNMIAILMSLVTAGTGAVVAMSALDREAAKSDGMLFAMSLGVILLLMIVLGCSMAYRRFMASGTTNIDDGNKLRH